MNIQKIIHISEFENSDFTAARESDAFLYTPSSGCSTTILYIYTGKTENRGIGRTKIWAVLNCKEFTRVVW